jgi:hypothetical protein
VHKGKAIQFLKGSTSHRLPKIVTLALASSVLVTMVTIDASASTQAKAGTANANLSSPRATGISNSGAPTIQLRHRLSPVGTITTTSRIGTTTSTSPTLTPTRNTTTTTTTTASRTTTSGAQYHLDLGLEVKSGLWNVAPVKSVESAIGYKISVVMGYIGWSYPASESYASNFPTPQLVTLSNDGYLPEITWEPWLDSSGVNQPNYSLASIIDGNHDSYIQSWAKAAKAYGKPLLIRFAQEMNGTWYPWSEQVNGNSPGEYVQAWQHVHNIFAEDAVQNVKWVWSPNVVGSGASSDLTELYPGDAYVDYIGIDGYSYPNDGCPTASELFGPTLAITNQLSARPAMIAETGIDSACSSQTSLMASLLNWASANARIIALTWFDRDTASADYSLTSSLESTMHLGTPRVPVGNPRSPRKASPHLG